MILRVRAAMAAIGIIATLVALPATATAAPTRTCTFGPFQYTVSSSHLTKDPNGTVHLGYSATATPLATSNACAGSGQPLVIHESGQWTWNPKTSVGAVGLTGTYSATWSFNNATPPTTWQGTVHGAPGPTAAAAQIRTVVSATAPGGGTLSITQTATVALNNASAGAPLHALTATKTTATIPLTPAVP